MIPDIDWNDVIKKEARGANNEDLGEIQNLTNGYVLTKRGITTIEKFYIPQDKLESYDGHTIRFSVSEEEY